MAAGIQAKVIACIVTALFTAVGIGPTAQADPVLDDCYIIQEGRPNKLLCITLDLDGLETTLVRAQQTEQGREVLYFGEVAITVGEYTITTYSAGPDSACPAFRVAILCSVIEQSAFHVVKTGQQFTDVLCLREGHFYFAPDSSGSPPTVDGPAYMPAPCIL